MAPTITYCRCETPVMDVEHDAGCRRCGLPVDFSSFEARVAADHIVTLLGGHEDERVHLLLVALRADWMTPDEAASLEELASAIAWIAERELPEHRSAKRRREAVTS